MSEGWPLGMGRMRKEGGKGRVRKERRKERRGGEEEGEEGRGRGGEEGKERQVELHLLLLPIPYLPAGLYPSWRHTTAALAYDQMGLHMCPHIPL